MNTPFTCIKGHLIFNKSHAQLPVVINNSNGYTIYFSRRDETNRSRVSFIHVDESLNMMSHCDKEIISLGLKDEFDEDGIMTSCIVDNFFYYTGWSRRINHPYSHSIGLAKIVGENTLEKMNVIIQSCKEDHFVCSSPYVIKEKNDLWRMWFISGRGCGGWTEFGPLYSVSYAESVDGMFWERKDIYFPRNEMEIFARPFVFFEDGFYYMLYTWMILGRIKRYKIGLAKSKDGFTWQRINDNFIDYSKEGWDSQMTAFPYRIDDLVFYSGNYFGRGGLGYAKFFK